VKYIIIGLVIIIITLVIIGFIGKCYIDKLKEEISSFKKESAELKKNLEQSYSIIDKERKNEKRKTSFNTGDSKSDFDSSISVLSELATKRQSASS
jgi:predicted Holliday junction resolvase-like endonuclease